MHRALPPATTEAFAEKYASTRADTETEREETETDAEGDGDGSSGESVDRERGTERQAPLGSSEACGSSGTTFYSCRSRTPDGRMQGSGVGGAGSRVGERADCAFFIPRSCAHSKGNAATKRH